MRNKQLIRGQVVDRHHGSISAEAICSIAESLIMDDLLKVFDEEIARKTMTVPEVFGPSINGSFSILGYFPEECGDTLRKMRDVFQSKHPGQVEIINIAPVQCAIDGIPKKDCGL